MRVWHGSAEADAGPRQQALLLALLLARPGRRTSTVDLVDLIWGAGAPATAVNVIHKYVGTLRRILEPSLPPRADGSYLLRQSNGYLFAAGADVLDLVAFRELVEAAHAESRPEAALDRRTEALRLWHGPAGDGLALGPEAMSIFAGLNDEFLAACTDAAASAVPLGRADQVLAPTRLAASMAPLHEPVHAALVSALGATGRQAEALAVFQAVRERLATELGVTPGEELLDAQRRVLRQTMTAPAPTSVVPMPPATTPAADLIGRVEEKRLCAQAVAVAADGGSSLIVVEGEPGGGKTRLLEEVAAEAGRRGVLAVWGRSLEGDGTPSMWPWTQVVGTLLETLPVHDRRPWRDGELGRLVEPRGEDVSGTLPLDSRTQFRLFEHVVRLVGAVAQARPLALLIDDLQWADVASLRLFSHLAARLPGGTMVVGALRDRAPAPGPDLLHLLAGAGRVPGHRRIRLGPLEPADVAELVRRETGQEPAGDDVRQMHARSAGNPFFVRELSRWSDTRAGVPSTVRDVVTDRVARLSPEPAAVLRTAALIGPEVDLRLLAGAAGIGVQDCLDLVEPLAALGLLESTPGDPFSFRFAHDLVRESVAAMTSPPQTARLHLRIADTLDQGATAAAPSAERLAHHLWSAGPLADPERTANALLAAARQAMAKTALETAQRHLTSAVQIARSADLTEVEFSALTQLTMVVGRLGYPVSAVDLLERAEHLARALGRDRDAADVLFARVVRLSQAVEPERGPLARRLYDWTQTSADPLVRACGHQAWGLRQWDVGDIEEAYRHLGQTHRTLLDDATADGDNALMSDLRLAWPMMQGVVTALHGDVEEARRLLDEVETSAIGNPYAVTVSCHYSGMVASMIDDPVWATRMVRRWLGAGPQDYAHVDNYLHITRCWARARSGDDPAGAAAEAEKVMAALLDPPQWGVSFGYALVADMLLAAGKPAEAAAALDKATHYLDVFGQRYAEGLILLLRAQAMEMSGEPAAAVRAMAEKARALSTERGAHLFARRAETFLTGLS
ncbi:ATP-binding protein [Paractinoplanes atraurantiacus]|nr:BTAD domain-containing putative transcriptional regulator [Actinoplanes atraurantiacus]